jgi:hypothetical protein
VSLLPGFQLANTGGPSWFLQSPVRVIESMASVSPQLAPRLKNTHAHHRQANRRRTWQVSPRREDIALTTHVHASLRLRLRNDLQSSEGKDRMMSPRKAGTERVVVAPSESSIIGATTMRAAMRPHRDRGAKRSAALPRSNPVTTR